MERCARFRVCVILPRSIHVVYPLLLRRVHIYVGVGAEVGWGLYLGLRPPRSLLLEYDPLRSCLAFVLLTTASPAQVFISPAEIRIVHSALCRRIELRERVTRGERGESVRLP